MGGGTSELAADRLLFPLFVPATRPDRIDKARATRATCVIADLEDAVAPDEKGDARQALASSQYSHRKGLPLCVRINAARTPWFDEDLAMVSQFGFAAVILPKAEDPDLAQALRRVLPAQTALFGLVETALGVAAVRDLAPLFDRLMFGSLDYAAGLGCAHTAPALAHARAELVLASRVAGLPGPVDGITADTRDIGLIQKEAALGQELGFKGKFLIHPAQIAPAKAAYRPSPQDVAWARKVEEAARDVALAKIDGNMVDAPVIAHARGILARAMETTED